MAAIAINGAVLSVDFSLGKVFSSARQYGTLIGATMVFTQVDANPLYKVLVGGRIYGADLGTGVILQGADRNTVRNAPIFYWK